MLLNHHRLGLLLYTPEKMMLFDKMSRRAKLLLLLIAFYSLSTGLSSIFITLYFFKINDSFYPPLFFYLGNYIGLIFGFIIGSLMLKKITINLVLGLGFILEAAFFAVLIALGPKSGNLALFMGLFFGISEGFIWLIRHLLEYESTYDGNRNRFFSSAYMLATISSIVAPLIAGFFIVAGEADHYSGYFIVFAMAALLLLAAGVVAFFVNQEVGLEFEFKELFKLDLHNKDWRSVEDTQFIQGLKQGAAPFLVTLATFFILKNELNVGGAASLGNAISVVVGYLIGRFTKSRHRLFLGWIGAVLVVVSYTILVLGFSITALISYILIVSVAAPALYVVFDTLYLSSIDSDTRGRQRRIIYLTNAEIYWDIGRIISVLVFLLMLQFLNPVTGVKYFLLISAFLLPVIIRIYGKYNSYAQNN